MSDKISTKEAIKICEHWFKYLDRQRDHTKRLATAAKIARTDQIKAKQILRQVDAEKMVVFDGAYLEPAVKHLVELKLKDVREQNNDT
ncbi:MAG: hypothetical protein ACUZ8E_12020 [Candidatus Anammoxibacter sp.]